MSHLIPRWPSMQSDRLWSAVLSASERPCRAISFAGGRAAVELELECELECEHEVEHIRIRHI